MAQVRSLTLPRDELEERLLPKLLERVFHVTTTDAYPSIQKTGAVLVEPPATSRHWSYDAHFRSTGCVSLCDLRGVDDEKIRLALSAYYFLNPRSDDADPVFLILRPAAIGCVVTYEEALEGGALERMIVPHIEAGYPGDLSLDLIQETIVVEIIHPPDGPFLKALKRYGRSEGSG